MSARFLKNFIGQGKNPLVVSSSPVLVSVFKCKFFLLDLLSFFHVQSTHALESVLHILPGSVYVLVFSFMRHVEDLKSVGKHPKLNLLVQRRISLE